MEYNDWFFRVFGQQLTEEQKYNMWSNDVEDGRTNLSFFQWLEANGL